MTGGGSAIPETITALLDAQGRALTKSFRWLGGKLVKGTYPNASEFKAVKGEVDGIASLAEALEAIVSDGRAAVIRGEPSRFYPRNGSPVFRLLRPQEGLVAARTGARISNYAIRKHNLEARPRQPMGGDVAADVRGLPPRLGDLRRRPHPGAREYGRRLGRRSRQLGRARPEPAAGAVPIGDLLVVAVVVRSGAVQDRPGGVRHFQAQTGVLARPRADGGARSSGGWLPRKLPSIQPSSTQSSSFIWPGRSSAMDYTTPCLVDPASGRAKPIPSRSRRSCRSRIPRPPRVPRQPSGRPKAWMSFASSCVPASMARCMCASTCCRPPAATCASKARTSIKRLWSRPWRALRLNIGPRSRWRPTASTAWSTTSSGRSAQRPGYHSGDRRARRG